MHEAGRPRPGEPGASCSEVCNEVTLVMAGSGTLAARRPGYWVRKENRMMAGDDVEERERIDTCRACAVVQPPGQWRSSAELLGGQ